MTRGRGTKRSWGGRGGMSNKGGEGYQQLSNTSHANISEPSTPISQQVGSNQHIISSHESSFRQLIRTSQDVHAQQTTSASQNIGGQQATPASLNIGHQQAPRSSQDVGSQQETHSQDVSAAQTLASYGSSNPQARRDTTRGIISLKVNGDTFCPHEAVRNKNYSFPSEDKVFIQRTFEHVGSERLSDSLGKAKGQFLKTKEIPRWIAKDHWDILMEYWNSENFKKKSKINSKNRMSSNNGEGPSLHTGGSVAFAEYRRRHKELTGKDLRNDELFLKTHITKNEKKWICGKSERMWEGEQKVIKEKIGETSTSRDEEGFEVDDEEMERNMATNGDEEGEKTREETVVDLLKTIPDEQPLETWIETVGRNCCGFVENHTR
uniref:Uncharacterized protein LOC104219389 n=1 Tax=Nicotiana sylvestris TaxID=4096 RepID=A0A1U7VTV6_NICSY|nr:PREDICTED: uncharacterized protein LOC104219389 [Nicotiana sylvestris]